MANIQQYVQSQIREAIKTEYPHLRLPAAVLAVITNVESDGVYRLRILDQNGYEDEAIPEIPGVASAPGLRQGEIVCAVLLYGQLNPYIIGRYLR